MSLLFCEYSRGVLVRRWTGAAVVGAALALLSACAPRPAGAPPTLRVIGTNDFHGALEARPNAAGVQWGGAAALAGAIRQARAECVAPACYSILVDAGDEFQGQASSTLARGWPVSEIFNMLGYDAAALGNHDLDWGRDTLRLRMAQEHYPVLSANLRYTDSRPVEWIAPDAIVRRGPFTIGVIGIMTLEAESAIAAANLAGLRFIDPVPVVDSLARDLRRRGANVIIVVAHAGAQCDGPGGGCTGEIVNDARRFTQPIDAVIAGHRHLRVNTRVGGIPVTSARMSGQAIDVIDLTAGRPARSDVRDVFVDSVTPDTAVARMVASAVATAGPRLAEPIATIADDMPRCDRGECALGDLIADVYRAAGHADFGAVNRGGVREPLRRGVATYSALFDVQPFNNRLVRITATGAAVRRYFERMVATRAPGAFISGATVMVDTSRAPGARIQSVTLPSGRPLDDAAAYTIVINDFMQTGGDELAFPDTAARVEELPGSDLDATVAYLRRSSSPVHASRATRWVIKP